MIFAGPSSTFTCSAQFSTSGLAGTVGVRIVNGSGSTVMSRTTSGITEPISSSGFYVATINLGALPAAPAPGHYYVAWDTGSVSPATVAVEDLYVSGISTLGAALRNLQAVSNTNNTTDINVGFFVP